MRKFTILLAMVAFATFAFGQKGFTPASPALSKGDPVKEIKQQMNQDKASTREIIWYEDFNGDAWSGTSNEGEPVPANAPEHWELYDYTGSGYFWRWDTVGPRGLFTSPGDDALFCHNPSDALNSSTTYNGFIMLEADYYNTLPDCSNLTSNGMNAAFVYTKPIDFTDYPSVHLVFEHTHRFCCSYNADQDAWFEVSTDGGETWTAKSVHEADINVNPGNAVTSDFDVSTMVGGQSNVTFRFRLQGLSHYHWEIDDIRFVVPVSNDIAVTDYWNDYLDDVEPELTEDFVEGFYQYPWFMIQDYEGFSVAMLNFGEVEQTGIVHTVDVTRNGQAIETYTTDPSTLAVGVNDTTELDLTDSLILPGKGVYEFIHYTTTAEGDQNPSNDTMKRALSITDSVLGPVDMTRRTGSVSPDNYTNHEDGRGLGFYTYMPDPSLHGDGSGDYIEAKSVRVYLTNQARQASVLSLIESGEAALQAQIYEYDPDADTYSLKVESAQRVLTLDDTASFITIPFQGNGADEIFTSGGEYLINLAFWGTWTDPYGRTASYDIGENLQYKASPEFGFLVDPNPGVGADAGYTLQAPMMEMHVQFSDAYPTPEYDVTFTVTDDAANPIEGATVYAGGKNAQTDASGVAVVPLEDGLYTYSVEEDGYGDVTGSFEVAGAAVSVDPVMNTEYMVTFSVTNDAAEAITNAKVEIAGETLSTGPDGLDSLALINGTYDYTVSLLGYDTVTGSVTVADAAEAIDITMLPTTYDVEFTVTDMAATALEGATVNINGTDYTTDASGLVTANVPFGTYTYTVTLDGYQGVSDVITVSENTTREVALEMYHTVTITVEDMAATPIEGASVMLGDMPEATTDASGIATMQAIDGTYQLIVMADGYMADTSEVVVDGGDVASTVQLTALYTVTFNITDENSDPVEGAEITIDGGTYTTDASGMFSIELVAGGTYDYTVTAGIHQRTGTIENLAQDEIIELTLPVGINDVNTLSFSVYPNPTSGQFTIEAQGQANVTIMNAAGKVVETMVINGTQQVNLNVASGVYFVRMKEADKVGVQRLIVE